MAITQRADIFAGLSFFLRQPRKGTVVLYDILDTSADQIHLHSPKPVCDSKF